jgi:D-amino-acid dehydrogenase
MFSSYLYQGGAMSKQSDNRMDGPDIVVIGAGIIGITAAIELLSRGARVTVMDRTGVAAGASQGNAGAFAFSDASPLASPGIIRKAPKWLFDPLGPLSIPLPYAVRIAPWMYRFWRASRADQVARGTEALTALMRVSRDHLENFMERTGTRHMLHHHGNLQLYEDKAAFKAVLPLWQRRAEHGVDYTALESVDAIKEAQAGIHPRFSRAILTPAWLGISDPKDYTMALGRYFEGAGGRIEISGVKALEVAGDRVSLLRDDGMRREADHIVVAAGAWSHYLARTLGDHIPLETERGYNTTLPIGAFDLKRQLSFEEHGFIVSPLTTGIRVGGAVELGGLKLPPNYSRADAMLRKAKMFLPKLKIANGRQWMGFRPSLPDSVPVIGPATQSSRVTYAFGHGHLGLTQSAGTAKLVAQHVMGETPEVDLFPYRAQRF